MVKKNRDVRRAFIHNKLVFGGVTISIVTFYIQRASMEKARNIKKKKTKIKQFHLKPTKDAKNDIVSHFPIRKMTDNVYRYWKISKIWMSDLHFVDGGSVLAGLFHRSPSLDLIIMVHQLKFKMSSLTNYKNVVFFFHFSWKSATFLKSNLVIQLTITNVINHAMPTDLWFLPIKFSGLQINTNTLHKTCNVIPAWIA